MVLTVEKTEWIKRNAGKLPIKVIASVLGLTYNQAYYYLRKDMLIPLVKLPMPKSIGKSLVQEHETSTRPLRDIAADLGIDVSKARNYLHNNKVTRKVFKYGREREDSMQEIFECNT